MKRILDIVISSAIFDLILAGTQREIVKELTDYWQKKITPQPTYVRIRRGVRGERAQYQCEWVKTDAKKGQIVIRLGRRVPSGIDEEMKFAEARALDKVMRDTLLGDHPFRQPKTLDDVFTHEERLRMAYAPVVMQEVIFDYIGRVTEYCRVHRISEVRKLTRQLNELKDSYYEWMRGTIDQHHIEQTTVAAAELRGQIGGNLARIWFTVRNEICRLWPHIKYLDMRTDAHCVILLFRALKKFCTEVDADIQNRMPGCKAKTLNPKLWNLDTIIEGYIGDYDIARTEIIQRCEAVLYNAMNTIQYKE